MNSVLDAINASNPQAEMDALTAKVSELTKLSLEITKLCIEVQGVSPAIALSKKALDMTALCLDVKACIPPAFISAAHAAAAAAVVPAAPPLRDPLWVQGTAITPDELEAQFGPGLGDNLPWQVVCIGREPGLYASVDDANDQLNGVPNQFRQKKSTRLEALAFYRHRYSCGKVEKWTEVPEDDDSA
ncbi:hypothetical protein B0H17DRAFT_1199136 [Mycena rosella]|uniref:Uncharacterized protein n=1 Tax=Mycena rosella TaxID=1033263 RepID=A0AAD7DLM7_MYCRO|nr:hypothetical protein B0H17DRAFT_1199136 [Mycena rosella]